jgi:heat shock protein HtpX
VLAAAIAGAVGLRSAYQISPAMVLKMYKARRLPQADFPVGHNIIDVLSDRAGLPSRPKLYYIPSKMMNAFAVGTREDSAIAVTDGLVRGLTQRQFVGVVAHEMSHIRNGDVQVMALGDVVNRMTSFLSAAGLIALAFRITDFISGGVGVWTAIGLLVAAPTIGGLLQLALSRAREYDADLDAAGLTGDPKGLASALVTLEKKTRGMWESLVLPGSRSPEPSLLRSHPRTEDRVARLNSLAPEPEPYIVFPDERPDLGGAITQVSRRPRVRMTGVWR